MNRGNGESENWRGQKISIGLIALCVFMIIMAAFMATARADYNPQYQNQGNVGTEQRQWKQGTFQSIKSYDGDGNLDTYVPADRVVYIDRATQLSTWGGATSGQSYYQCEPGKTYVVDPYMISVSGVTSGNGISAFTKAPFTGVSLILPNAKLYSGPAYDTTVLVATIGATGYLVNVSGNTIVQVWPYPGTVAGLTAYGKEAATYGNAYRAGCTPQTMHSYYSVNGTVTHERQGSGVSYYELNKQGESAVFGTFDSQVSAFVKARNVTN